MKTCIIRWSLLLILICLCSATAMAQDSKTNEGEAAAEEAVPVAPLVLDLISVKEEVILGDNFEFTVRVLNVSDETQDIRLMDWHYESVYLKAKYEGEEFELGHMLSRGNSGRAFSKKYDFDTIQLLPGRSAKCMISFPAVGMGSFEFTAMYETGLADTDALESIHTANVQVVEAQGANTLVAVMEIEYGAADERKTATLEYEFYPQYALNTVTHQVQLMQKGFFDGLSIHRIIPDQVVQGGDPAGNGSGGPGYQIKQEFNDNTKHELGALSMARSTNVDSAGSQFFICSSDIPIWDAPSPQQNRYTVWGKALQGEDTLTELTAIKIESQTAEYRKKIREIRDNNRSKPEKEKLSAIKRETAALEKNKDRPTQKITIVSFAVAKRTLEKKAEDESGSGEDESTDDSSGDDSGDGE